MILLRAAHILFFTASIIYTMDEDWNLKYLCDERTFFEKLEDLWEYEPNLDAIVEICRGKNLFINNKKDESIEVLHRGLNKVDIEAIEDHNLEYMHNIVGEAFETIIKACEQSNLEKNKKLAPLYKAVFYSQPKNRN